MSSTQATKEGQVRQQLRNLEKAIESLGSEITNLGNRLHLVMREAEIQGDSAKTPKETLVPLAEEIRGQVEQVRALDCRLSELSKCLEL